MCGRTSLKASPEEIAEAFGLSEPPEWNPRYNIAPTQSIPVVRLNRAGDRRELHALRFGLVPFWEKTATGARYLNARVESLFTARPFAAAAKKRHCLVVADSFYEWKGREGAGKRGAAPRTPYRIHFEGDTPFALAGVWDRFTGSDGEVIESCAIVTAPSSGVVAPIHDRMPVFVPREAYAEWLRAEPDTGGGDPAALVRQLAEAPPPWIATPISRYVNDPRHEGPECFAPPEPGDAVQEVGGASSAARGGTLALFDADGDRPPPPRRARRV